MQEENKKTNDSLIFAAIKIQELVSGQLKSMDELNTLRSQFLSQSAAQQIEKETRLKEKQTELITQIEELKKEKLNIALQIKQTKKEHEKEISRVMRKIEIEPLRKATEALEKLFKLDVNYTSINNAFKKTNYLFDILSTNKPKEIQELVIIKDSASDWRLKMLYVQVLARVTQDDKWMRELENLARENISNFAFGFTDILSPYSFNDEQRQKLVPIIASLVAKKGLDGEIKNQLLYFFEDLSDYRISGNAYKLINNEDNFFFLLFYAKSLLDDVGKKQGSVIDPYSALAALWYLEPAAYHVWVMEVLNKTDNKKTKEYLTKDLSYHYHTFPILKQNPKDDIVDFWTSDKATIRESYLKKRWTQGYRKQ